ncbi:MAG: exosortase-associated EpsI family protein [Planctomycetota bacterium]|nr:exosortase-associated EpsI family protein [Planctomycetota bacterium]
MRRQDARSLWSFGAGALVLGSMIALGHRGRAPDVDSTAYFAQAAEAISRIPYRIEGWVGADVEAQAPAVQLLRPNKLLQRRYISTDVEREFVLLFVHCADARDMQGHYPPICYPAHGWTLVDRIPAEFKAGSSLLPGTVYRLETVRQGEKRHMSILNFFAMPGAAQGIAPDMEAVNRASASSATSVLGAAQVQLVLQHEATPPELTELMATVFPAIEPAVWSVVRGNEADAD